MLYKTNPNKKLNKIEFYILGFEGDRMELLGWKAVGVKQVLHQSIKEFNQITFE